MKIVGLTGGIGSGKTTAANMFKEMGAPVYFADVEAKKLTNTSKIIRRKLIQLLGKEAYVNNELNRKFVASKIFKDADLLQEVNSVIHPKVAKHFARWVKNRNAPYCIKEAAILFESGSYQQCDVTVLVTAPREVRIKRVMQRDDTSKKAVLDRMEHQWSDERKKEMADFVIENTTLDALKEQIIALDKKLSEVP